MFKKILTLLKKKTVTSHVTSHVTDTKEELFFTKCNDRATIDRIRDLSYFIAHQSLSSTLSEEYIDNVADVFFQYFCFAVAVASKDRGQSDDLSRSAFFGALGKDLSKYNTQYQRQNWTK